MEDKNITAQNQNTASDAVSQTQANVTIANAAKVVASEDQPKPLFRETGQSIPAASSGVKSSSDIFSDFAEKIIKEQESIIGPIAYEQAAKVTGIKIDPTTHAVSLEGDKKTVLENLVKQYELLFGRVSIEICKEAVRSVIGNAPVDQVPQILL